MATAFNSGDSSVSQPSLRNSTLNWQLSDWRPIHTNPLAFSSLAFNWLCRSNCLPYNHFTRTG
jgi:hypothetical protein